MAAESVSGTSYNGSSASSKSSNLLRDRNSAGHQDGENGDDMLDRRSSFEQGIFGVLFTLSKEKSETRIRIRWVLLKILLDGWQLFTTVINPYRQPWNINPDGAAWTMIGVLNFTWLGDLGYNAYLAVLYAMLVLLAINVVMCVWVAWCFKEQKFPVVWPIQVLRVFSSVFFQAFDVASLNLLQLGIRCRYTGPVRPHMHFDLFPEYGCTSMPHLTHAVVSALCLVLFVTIALMLNMAEVEVNPLSRRPLALGHSGSEVACFAIRVLLTLVDVFLGWERVAACVYVLLSLALARQYLRWSPHLVAWVNYLKSGSAVSVVWCSTVLVLLVFHPGVRDDQMDMWSDAMTITMLAGIVPAFGLGVLMSRTLIRRVTATTLKALTKDKDAMLRDLANILDEPRDVEIVARSCRPTKEPFIPDPEAVEKAHELIKAGLEQFPGSPYMVLLHANFMIDVLGISQSGARRIEDARKLNPNLFCRFIMFIRQQQATQSAAGTTVNSSGSMDLLGYVEYQRKQRMVVRLHREALHAMCNFWRALDSQRVSFMTLSKALGKIDTSVTQAQVAYRVCLERYGNNPKLVHLYGKFLHTIKNDPWHAAEYFKEAERLEELQGGNDVGGPVMPDGTPLARMDEMDTAVLVVSAEGLVQMANKRTHSMFGYARGALEGKPIATLLTPQYSRWVTTTLSSMVSSSPIVRKTGDDDTRETGFEEVAVGVHSERLAFPIKLSIRRASGVGEDSTLIVMAEPVPTEKGVATMWVAPNGVIAACDPRFVANFGWKPAEVNAANISALMLIDADISGEGGDEEMGGTLEHMEGTSAGVMKRLVTHLTATAKSGKSAPLPCMVRHKYEVSPLACHATIIESAPTATIDSRIYEVRLKLASQPVPLLVVNRKGAILHASADVFVMLKDNAGAFASRGHIGGLLASVSGPGNGIVTDGAAEVGTTPGNTFTGYNLFDFLTPPWKDMHVKFMKEITPGSPIGLGAPTCRRNNGTPPTLTMRSAAGKELLMQVSVSTADSSSEVIHVIRMTRSSVEEALAERRMRIGISADGLINSVIDGNPKALFGLEAQKIIGQELSELMQDRDGARVTLPKTGPEMVAALIDRAVAHPGYSWRVNVVPPLKPGTISSAQPNTAIGAFSAAARAALNTKPAIMQVHMTGDEDTDPNDGSIPQVYVDVWPVANVTGILELDSAGRVRSVLEASLRPVGLIFGVPGPSLVGSMLSDLLDLPPGCRRPGDLLSSLNSIKKSSLKTSKKDAAVKVGPMHTLPAPHFDGRPVSLRIQMIGKPGSEDSIIAILRLQTAPMMPSTAGAVAASGGAPLPLISRMSFRAPPPEAKALNPDSAGCSRPQNDIAAIDKEVTQSLEKLKEEYGAPGQFNPRASCRSSALLRGSGSLGGSTPTAAVPLATLAPTCGRSSFRDAGTPDTSVPQGDLPRSGSSKRLTASLLDRNTINGGFGSVGSAGSVQVPQLLSTSPLLATVPEEGIVTPKGTKDSLQDLATSVNSGSPDAPGVLAMGPVVPVPPAILQDGLPVPRVTTTASSKSLGLAVGRSKLLEMVQAAAGEQPSTWTSSERQRRLMCSRLVNTDHGPLQETTWTTPGLPGSVEGFGVKVTGKQNMSTSAATARRNASPVQVASSVEEEEDGDSAAMSMGKNSAGSDTSALAPKPNKGPDRVREWVVSRGAFFQNSPIIGPKALEAEAGDDKVDKARDTDGHSGDESIYAGTAAGSFVYRDSGPGGLKKAFSLKGGAADPSGMPPDGDDDASDGGQSAMSAAHSATSNSTEYSRGKRFRKLMKLMDSAQARQVQQRLRVHALVTLLLLAVAHSVCFVLTTTAIQSQRTSMLSLGRSGQAQVFAHQILTDVRSLDIISANKSLPHLFAEDDVSFFLARIKHSAEELKKRFNEILNTEAHRSAASPIVQVLYNSMVEVWDENEPDGTDKFTNITLWDFATRFCTKAKFVYEDFEKYHDSHMRIADTNPGQFLLKSGPNLWREMYKVLRALLFLAVDNAENVDRLQVAFLVVEGAAISFLSACYLTYLLRSVAVQRYKLYGAFLVIPVGLTRALASQNTNLLEDDEDDDEDEEEEKVTATDAADEPGPSVSVKFKHQSILKDGSNDCTEESSRVIKPQQSGRGFKPQRTLTKESLDDGNKSSKFLSSSRWRLTEIFSRTFRNISMQPFSQQQALASAVGAITGTQSFNTNKRSLKCDSHDTIIMLSPFILWSTMVITIYAVAVVWMNGVVDDVAIHSVVNVMSGRTYRTVFFAQELANVEDPMQLPAYRAQLRTTMKSTKDAWYTLQLGKEAHIALGDDMEVFPLVDKGISHAKPMLEKLFYKGGKCHRFKEHQPCPARGEHFYEISHTGIDSIMQQFIFNVYAMATSKSMTPAGLQDEHFDFVYNIGSKDLLDGVLKIAKVHYTIVEGLFDEVLYLHIILFMLFWGIFAGFLIMLLNPLLKRVTKERRSIAELLSQLPLELDVEKLVARALGTVGTATAAGPGGQSVGNSNERMVNVDDGEIGSNRLAGVTGVNKWKAVIRMASNGSKRASGTSAGSYKGK